MSSCTNGLTPIDLPPRVNLGRREAGSALLETVIIIPIVLSLLAGILSLGDLALTTIHLAHTSRLAAREYMLSQEIRQCRTFVYRAIEAGDIPLDSSRLTISLLVPGTTPPEDNQGPALPLDGFLKGVAAATLGTTLELSYRWGGLRLFGLELPPLVLRENCTVLAGSWRLCSD